jgi:diguanylate cyclase (GGDEF)-like protein/PAS domain S-box-containing protein
VAPEKSSVKKEDVKKVLRGYRHSRQEQKGAIMCAKDITASAADMSEGFFAELVMRHSSDGVIICAPDCTAIWVNTGFAVQTGHAPEEILGRFCPDVLRAADSDPEVTRKIEAALAERREIRIDAPIQGKSGALVWVDLRVTPVFDNSGRHTYFIAIMRDITERKLLEGQNEEMRHAEALRQSERQLLALTSEWLYSAKSFAELLMVIKRAMHTLIPEAEGALYIYDTPRSMLELVTSWGSAPAFAPHILPDDCWALRRGRAYSYGLKPIEFACDHVDNPNIPYFCLPIIAHGETIGLMHIVFDGFEEDGIMRHMRAETLRNRWDISLICAEQISLAVANVRLRQELLEQSVRDPLTGLHNRRWFSEHAAREIMLAERDDKPLALIALDIDHFKQFNDRFGHDVGDLVLKEVAAALSRAMPNTAHLCRFGGEEFVVLCCDQTEQQTLAQAEALRLAVADSTPVITGQILPPVTISAGIGRLGRDGTSLDDILKAADRALYKAKAQGRNRVVGDGSEPLVLTPC